MGALSVLDRQGRKVAEYEATPAEAVEFLNLWGASASPAGSVQANAPNPIPAIVAASGPPNFKDAYKAAIKTGIRGLPPPMNHSTEDMQKWVFGRTLNEADVLERQRIDRARVEAHEELGKEFGGEFVRVGKDGRQWLYALVGAQRTL